MQSCATKKNCLKKLLVLSCFFGHLHSAAGRLADQKATRQKKCDSLAPIRCQGSSSSNQECGLKDHVRANVEPSSLKTKLHLLKMVNPLHRLEALRRIRRHGVSQNYSGSLTGPPLRSDRPLLRGGRKWSFFFVPSASAGDARGAGPRGRAPITWGTSLIRNTPSEGSTWDGVASCQTERELSKSRFIRSFRF